MGKKRKPPSPVEEEVIRRERFREIQALKNRLRKLPTKTERMDFLDDMLREILQGATPDDDVEVLQIVAKEFRILPELSSLINRFDLEAQRSVRSGELTILEGAREGELRQEPLTSLQRQAKDRAQEDRRAFLQKLKDDPQLRRELAIRAGLEPLDIETTIPDAARLRAERLAKARLRKEKGVPPEPIERSDVERLKQRIQELRAKRSFRKGPFDR